VKWIFVLIALITVNGCGEGGEAPVLATAPQQSSTPERDRPTEVEMVAWMEGHYSVVILANDALLQGDLDGFRSQLALVGGQELPASSPKSWLPLHEALQAAASEGAEAENGNAAAEVLASVVLACGTCHAALGSGPIYPAPAPEDGANPLQAAMLDHKWATERLWEGVTGPWENAWKRGADGLAVTEIFGDQGEAVLVSEFVLEREQQLRSIGEEAKATTALEARAALYGRLLLTCGECHQAISETFENPE